MDASNSSSSAHCRRPSITRTPACTHISFTRKFTTSKDEVCDLCYRSPFLGWLYCCTEDSDGFLPASEFNGELFMSHSESDAQLYTLSESVLAAAQRGHYTDEELSTLWKQKSRVRDFVRQIKPYPPSSTSSTASSSRQSLTTSTTFSTIQSYDSDTDSDLDYGHLADESLICRTVLEPIQEVSDETSEEEVSSFHLLQSALAQPRTGVCQHRVCHSCRPGYRERSFQSINQIVLLGRLPPKHEWENKRLSYATVLKDLNVNPPQVVTMTDRSTQIADVISQLRGVSRKSQGGDYSTTKMYVGALQQVSTCHNLSALAATVNISTEEAI